LWWAAAIINTVFATLIVCKKIKVTRQIQRKGIAPWIFYIPAFILFGSGAYFFWNRYPSQSLADLKLSHLLMITWVPLVEEITYRQGLSGWCRNLLNSDGLWGSYFSALIFALLHGMFFADFTIDNMLQLILGPFVLAIVAEFLYRNSGEIASCVVLHSCCNLCALVLG
jgi:membrane protease YdiL (CAAX protease family)